ncbi:MAG: hypothetical protein ACI9KN_000563 [Gammaproteobacteria bacterium]|jgi:hypothetical protein
MQTMHCIVVLCLVMLGLSPLSYAFDDRQLVQPVTINTLVIVYPEFAVFKLPGSTLAIKAASPITLTPLLSVSTTSKSINYGAAKNRLEFIIPDTPGRYDYTIKNLTTGQSLLLHVYALTPATAINHKGTLDNYRIGQYPKKPLKGLAIYKPPVGFTRIEAADVSIHVSPNFTIGQFLSKQQSRFPKYVVLRPELIIKLEHILRALNVAGHDIDNFHIMSGYRTPFYNQAIGNVKYSRHQWGGAADIFIDSKPVNNRMDDLNRDGVINIEDAKWLAQFINSMSQRGEFKNLGGLGIYGSNAAHGPFVHVDVRGERVRW